MKAVRRSLFSGSTAGSAAWTAAGRTTRIDMIFALRSATSAAGAPASAAARAERVGAVEVVRAHRGARLGERARGEERPRVREALELGVVGAQQVDVMLGGVALGLDQAALGDALVREHQQARPVGAIVADARGVDVGAHGRELRAVHVELEGVLVPAVRVVEPVLADRLLRGVLELDAERIHRGRDARGRTRRSGGRK